MKWWHWALIAGGVAGAYYLYTRSQSPVTDQRSDTLGTTARGIFGMFKSFGQQAGA